MEQASRTKTFGAVFPQFDDRARLPTHALNGSFNLLLWDGAEANKSSASVPLAPGLGSDFKARIFEPPDVDSTIRRAMRFPSHEARMVRCRELFNDVCSLIKKFTDLAPRLVSLAAYSVFPRAGFLTSPQFLFAC